MKIDFIGIGVMGQLMVETRWCYAMTFQFITEQRLWHAVVCRKVRTLVCVTVQGRRARR